MVGRANKRERERVREREREWEREHMGWQKRWIEHECDESGQQWREKSEKGGGIVGRDG